MLKNLVRLSKLNKQILLFIVDYLSLVLVLLLAFAIRNGYWSLPNNESYTLIPLIFSFPIVSILIFIKFGLYRAIVRFIDVEILWEISKACILNALMLSLFLFMSSIQGFPRSVIVINLLLMVIVFSALRLIAKWTFNKYLVDLNSDLKNVLIYGAGSAGRQMASALQIANEYNPIALIDDDVSLHGRFIKGIEVFSSDSLDTLIKQTNAKEVFIAMPSIGRNRRAEIINLVSSYSVVVRSLPGLSELAQGKIQVSDLKEVSIDDLLGRVRIQPDYKLLKSNISNKVVLVTGAGGSIGSELCRQIVLLKAKELILFELSEFALYQINNELAELEISNLKIYPILGSVVDKNTFSNVLKLFKVNTIYHAAAYKHVPIVEFNNEAGVNNNIFGTLSCAESAIENMVETFVLVSTDKAVRPTNTMGATKRFSEQILQGLAEIQNDTNFTIVRFGNVLGSSGSVIPLFKRQIKKGGPITVTSQEMTRYFMLVSEAVELVIQAGAMSKAGEVFVLDMGEPVRIDELAKKMINLSGLKIKDEKNKDGDIEIIYSGIRPGEKLFEELLIGDNVDPTSHPMIMKAKEGFIEFNKIKAILSDLKIAIEKNDYQAIRSLLVKGVPEFNPEFDLDDILYSKGKTK